MGIVEHARLSKDERSQLLDGLYDLWFLAHGIPLSPDEDAPEGGS